MSIVFYTASWEKEQKFKPNINKARTDYLDHPRYHTPPKSLNHRRRAEALKAASIRSGSNRSARPTSSASTASGIAGAKTKKKQIRGTLPDAELGTSTALLQSAPPRPGTAQSTTHMYQPAGKEVEEHHSTAAVVVNNTRNRVTIRDSDDDRDSSDVSEVDYDGTIFKNNHEDLQKSTPFEWQRQRDMMNMYGVGTANNAIDIDQRYRDVGEFPNSPVYKKYKPPQSATPEVRAAIDAKRKALQAGRPVHPRDKGRGLPQAYDQSKSNASHRPRSAASAHSGRSGYQQPGDSDTLTLHHPKPITKRLSELRQAGKKGKNSSNNDGTNEEDANAFSDFYYDPDTDTYRRRPYTTDGGQHLPHYDQEPVDYREFDRNKYESERSRQDRMKEVYYTEREQLLRQEQEDQEAAQKLAAQERAVNRGNNQWKLHPLHHTGGDDDSYEDDDAAVSLRDDRKKATKRKKDKSLKDGAQSDEEDEFNAGNKKQQQLKEDFDDMRKLGKKKKDKKRKKKHVVDEADSDEGSSSAMERSDGHNGATWYSRTKADTFSNHDDGGGSSDSTVEPRRHKPLKFGKKTHSPQKKKGMRASSSSDGDSSNNTVDYSHNNNAFTSNTEGFDDRSPVKWSKADEYVDASFRGAAAQPEGHHQHQQYRRHQDHQDSYLAPPHAYDPMPQPYNQQFNASAMSSGGGSPGRQQIHITIDAPTGNVSVGAPPPPSASFYSSQRSQHSANNHSYHYEGATSSPYHHQPAYASPARSVTSNSSQHPPSAIRVASSNPYGAAVVNDACGVDGGSCTNPLHDHHHPLDRDVLVNVSPSRIRRRSPSPPTSANATASYDLATSSNNNNRFTTSGSAETVLPPYQAPTFAAPPRQPQMQHWPQQQGTPSTTLSGTQMSSIHDPSQLQRQPESINMTSGSYNTTWENTTSHSHNGLGYQQQQQQSALSSTPTKQQSSDMLGAPPPAAGAGGAADRYTLSSGYESTGSAMVNYGTPSSPQEVSSSSHVEAGAAEVGAPVAQGHGQGRFPTRTNESPDVAQYAARYQQPANAGTGTTTAYNTAAGFPPRAAGQHQKQLELEPSGGGGALAAESSNESFHVHTATGGAGSSGGNTAAPSWLE